MAHISILFLSSTNSEKNNIKVAWVHNPELIYLKGIQVHKHMNTLF